MPLAGPSSLHARRRGNATRGLTPACRLGAASTEPDRSQPPRYPGSTRVQRAAPGWRGDTCHPWQPRPLVTGRRGVPLDDRAEDADGGQRRRLHRLRAGAHVRQPQGVRRPRRLQRVRRAPAHASASRCSRTSGCSGCIRVGADRRAGRARDLRRGAVAPGRRRPAPARYVVKQNRASTFSSRMMRWGGLAHPAVPGLAPAQLHDRQGQRLRRADRRPLRPARRHLRRLVADA